MTDLVQLVSDAIWERSPISSEDATDAARRVLAVLNDNAFTIDRAAVDTALRQVVSHIDYDTHKYLECDEETGEDVYGEHVDRFVAEYNKAVGS